MIIATAGHVDHGKTSLVRQLTGVETDTLAEEKARGLSINLGYAYLPCADGSRLGFIDVPGHQRFINTMISGISGIDMGLLVIAADDGPMPQTLEHLDVLDILGVEQLSVVISKIDRVSESRLQEVEQHIHGLLNGRRWHDAALFPVSSETGSGIPALETYLQQQAQRIRARQAEGGFRLSIDRAFSAKGAGLVVTGTANAGKVLTGDRLLLLPGNREVRVRDLRAHNEPATAAVAGQRVALNLAGSVSASDIERGDWLVDADHALSSERLDVSFTLLKGAPFPLKHLAPVKLHIGAKRVAGKLALVEGSSGRLHAGESCIAQLLLDEPVNAMLGDRFLLRDTAENVILGGGAVLDPQGPKFGKSRPGRITWLQAMQADTPEDALAQLIAKGQLVELNRFWAIRNRRLDQVETLLPADAKRFEYDGRHWAIGQKQWSEASQHLNSLVDDWHETHPHKPGIKMTELKAAVSRDYQTPLVMAALVSRLKSGDLLLHDGHISRTGFRRTESKEVQSHWKSMRQHLEQCQLRVPLFSELAAAIQVPEPTLRQVVKEATRSGNLHRLNDKRYALPEHLLHFSRRVVEADREGEELSVINLKARFQSGRNLTIELLEYFDSIHFTRREGNTRIVINPAAALERFGAQGTST
ncbi:MAG: selenocysteine-specific translation elongation factor [Halieaceae bacterium]|nr:selenocysteine-specific translation elongation factor [Halieaceae bacterium]